MKLWILVLALASAVFGEECSVTIQGVDPIGNSVEVVITSITSFEFPRQDLLRLGAGLGILRVSGSTMHFKKGRIEPVVLLNVGVEQRGASRSMELLTIPFIHCGQTSTVVMGQRAHDPHVSFDIVKGRLTGCNCASGDFWVRLVPMFGAISEARWFEARVDPPQCKFAIHGTMRGVRHILIIGRGADSLRVRDVNVSVGQQMDLGPLDISSSCKATK